MLHNMAYGHLPNALPYTMQDNYTRQLSPRKFRMAVLENEILRATFLLELGGRLWSLVHKPSGRELLYVNPVLQPGNLAIRNAWFSGGVEWNIGTIGHSPFTCAPLFVARVEARNGTPILRLYEYERFRGVPFQIDAYLPNGSPVLFVRVRITNPHGRATPMYWWSNIAIPETPATRVVVPADSAYRFGYEETGLMRIPVPQFEATDYTYSTNLGHSADFFFDIPNGHRPWITGLDEEGKGLIQTSTPRLIGRKLFLWGTGAGGRKWQRFLSPAGGDYIEIQAGLARTQMEHLPMPPRTNWSWLEAYGLIEVNPTSAHGGDWARARRTVEDELEALVPRLALEAEFKHGESFVDLRPTEVVQRGSGWGALERVRREVSGEPAFSSSALVFDDASLGEAQEPWLDLLRHGAFPLCDPSKAPRGYVVHPAWRRRLETAVATRAGGDWSAWYHLGIMRHYAGLWDAARRAWEVSLEKARTPWAFRNLAVLACQEQDVERAAELYLEACRLAPALYPLAAECGRFLIETDRPEEWLTLLTELDPSLYAIGRIRLLKAQASLAVGDLKHVERFFADVTLVPDIREGEVSLADLWFAFHERRLSLEKGVPVDDALCARVRHEFPLPNEFDFRMTID
jgi:tetratricopeptide (TPR) repeat protein